MSIELHQALTEGGLEPGTHYQMKGVYLVDAWEDVLRMLNGTPYPTEQQVATWFTAAQAKLDAAALVALEQNTIKTLSAQAKQHASKIRACFEVIPTADTTPATDAQRYAGYRTVLNNQPQAFRDLVTSAFTSEKGLTIDLSLTPANVPIATRQAFNDFYRGFFNTWVIMLYAAS